MYPPDADGGLPGGRAISEAVGDGQASTINPRSSGIMASVQCKILVSFVLDARE